MDLNDFEKLFNDNLEDIIGLLKIPSVYDEHSATANMPYGSNVHKAFVYMKDKAISDGFAIEEYDGHALSIESGQGKERIDIACHLDVVAADKEDFNIRIEDDKLYGRGSVDMKVPMYLCYLSIKLLKEKYPEMNKRIRLVLGGDEERTMNDLKYYVEKAGYPAFAFTPDGYFPVGIGEKGAIMWELKGSSQSLIESLHAGTQCNIISPHAECVINDISKEKQICDYFKENEIMGEVMIRNEQMLISIEGLAAHASRPWQGHSATNDLLELLSEIYADELCTNLSEIFNDHYGRGFDSFISEDPDECLSVNLGILQIKDHQVYAQVDCRYPYGIKSTELTGKLKEKCLLEVSLPYDDKPTLCDENDIYVRTLLETYQEITHDYSKPVVSGGVSYAKVFGHCVSYGPGKNDEDSLAHQKGEYIPINECIRMFMIYYQAIERLILLEER